jgi:hypothetical protein
MADMINVTATAAGTPATKNEMPTLKLVSDKVHLGPRPSGLKAKTNLSTATGKVLFNNDLKVVIKGTDQMSSKPIQPGSSTLIKLSVGAEATQAALYMLAWDHVLSIGTKAYKEKFEALQRARASAYADLGFSNSADKRPELTAQQREIYNAKVTPFAFDYFEYKLSFKQPGKKAVRSKTYRSLKPMEPDGLIKQLTLKAKSLGDEISFKTKSPKA